MTISSVREALRAFAQSLQVSSLFPASLFVITNFYFLLPLFMPIDLNDFQTLTLATSLTLILSYLLYAFNFPLIRLMEGYKLQQYPPFSQLREHKLKQFLALQANIDCVQTELIKLDNEDPPASADCMVGTKQYERWTDISAWWAKMERHKDINYPSKSANLRATKLGNAIAAFEDYARTRYGMETIALWPRLVPILHDADFIRFVSQEKSVFDFLLNMLVLGIVAGLEFFYLGLFFSKYGYAIGALVLTPISSWILYEGLIIAARQWGSTVRVAFDLHRHTLHSRLGLRENESFQSDVAQWKKVSAFFAYQPKATDIKNMLEFLSSDKKPVHDLPPKVDRTGSA